MTTENNKHEVLQVFAEDEMSLLNVDPKCSSDELLAIPGVFYMKDVARALELSPHDLKRRAKHLEDKGESAWEVMGVRKTWSHWIVRMTKFAPYFRKFMLPALNKVQPEWDANEMLSKKGIFYLNDVCSKLPFTPHHIKYQVRRNPKAREKFGVWKDDEYKTYLVEMPKFAKWIGRIWS